VSFYRSEDTKGRAQRRLESLTFETLGRSQALLRRFVDEVAAVHSRRSQSTSLLYVYDGYWNCVQAYAPRLLDSVILHGREKALLVEDMRRFRAARERYRRLGVPYHRGYLFYGPPGTGKTSLVSALAGDFGMSIYLLNLTTFNDSSLQSAMNEVPENSIILFEDIDCMGAGKRRKIVEGDAVEKEPRAGDSLPSSLGVTLSGLLNVLDGFHAPENVIFVMTTNDIHALDPALLRPGRIDYRLHLGHASPTQKAELYRRFFPQVSEAEATAFAQAHAEETMAEFQGKLLRLEETQAITASESMDEAAEYELISRG
jgi:chaperone BCS1